MGEGSGRMIIIYNQNGTVDLAATRECLLGNPTEEDLEEAGELRPMPKAKSAYEEFWSDPCWTEPPGHLG